ncbi:sensor histidine kinase [Paenibacillus mendelii]|uniref:Sensor histidine kinase n=1 Tax=Paenibacillus mendelii TaxID=206163 RepID=A0ABV6JKT2_9BACL|nr:histidine kinase [Paenibacillus mendelii]MCQ6560647.1 histidine kinase [Paenibacillus mendelii]
MRSLRSFKTKLFITYSLTLITITLMASIPLYFYLKHNIEKNIVTHVQQLAQNTTSNLNSYISMFDNIAFQFYNSHDNTRTTVAGYMGQLLAQKQQAEGGSHEANLSINNFLMIVSSVYNKFDQINLYSNSGLTYTKMVGNTAVRQIIGMDLNFESADEMKGGVALSSNEHGGDHSIPALSLTRKLMWYATDLGYIEAVIRPESIIDTVHLQEYSGASLLILHHDQVIYNSTGATEAVSKSSNAYRVNDKTYRGDFTVLLQIPKDQLFKPLQMFRLVMSGIVFFVILFSVLCFYLLARSLTQPLSALKIAMDNARIDDDGTLPITNKYKMNEIESLKRSFHKMNTRLKDSIDDKLHFRTLQLRSHFQTLQAQINPHFLFNMLSVMTILSDRKDAAAVSSISRKLSLYLRYAISSESEMTALSHELAFTDSYLELMKSRHLHRLNYTIQVQDEMMNLQVPKLSLQPLVENCIQHGLTDDIDQIHIQLSGYMQGEQWTIEICDDGAGFQGDTLSQIHRRVEDYIHRLQDENDAEPLSLSIGGMGLVSTLARLKLLWKSHMTYEISNLESRGTRIAISVTMVKEGETI